MQQASGPLNADIILRLQQIISTWNGAQRGEPLSALHQQCVNVMGRGSRPLPAQLLSVSGLDVTRLRTAFRRVNGVGRNTNIQFRVAPAGRFDMALVPVGRTGSQPDRFVLAFDDTLPLQDQVALYGHAVGHLLLNYQEEQLGQRPQLDPRNGYAHADTLAELRLMEMVKQPIDHRVLETFPLLTGLLEPPEESIAAFDTATVDLRERLVQAGWRPGSHSFLHYQLTAGRVYPSSPRRGARLHVDALLRVAPSLPIAVVHSIRPGEPQEQAISRVQGYARRMALPFAYLLDEQGTFQEFDWSQQQLISTTLTAFPSREDLFNRWLTALQLTDQRSRRALVYPYELISGKTPRYYQEAAINTALVAVLQALRGLHPRRILLTLATGTGKTLVAFQLLWKLKRERVVSNVLFLTDRDFLLSQAMDNEFAPFGDGRYRLQGNASRAYDVDFATYQGITALDEQGQALYQKYPRDFFDVVVIDECHRGSAKADSQWRRVLEYFSDAVQVGLTATPLKTDLVQTDDYFGESVYTYSLRMGITDGFLAPYRVRRMLIGPDEEEEPLMTPGEQEAQQSVQLNLTDDEEELPFVDIPISMATPGEMIARTQVIAQHLAAFLERTGKLAKTIVFCVDQPHAEQMRVALEAACSSWAPRTTNYVVRIVSEEGTEGRRALGSFTTPGEPYPVIVTTSKLLGTGIDIPTCQNIALARPVGSLVEFKQIIGRGTRLFEPQKRWFTILDYAGTIKHFFDPAFDGDPEFVEKEVLDIPPIPEETNVPQDTPSTSESPISSSEEATTGHTPQVETTAQGATEQSDTETRGTSSQEEEQPSSSPASTPWEQEGEVQYQPAQEVCMNCPASSTQVASPHISRQAEEQTKNEPGQQSEQSSPDAPGTIKHTKDGRTLKIVGEIVYELGPDGSELRLGSYREYAVSTLQSLVKTPDDLRARWLREEQRKEVLSCLEDSGVDLGELAYQQRLTELDPLDLLLHVVFHEQVITRQQRVERLRREHTDFFKRYENNLLARAVLDAILDRYIAGEAPDVSDTELLSVLSLTDRHTPYELAQPFTDKETNSNVRAVLRELHMRLYSV